MADAGVAAFKIYMVVDTGRDYPHPSGTGIHDHGHLLRMFEAIGPTGLPFMIHPHDQAIMDVTEQSHWDRGDRSPAAYAQTLATHNGLIWDAAIAVILQMAEATGTKLHIVHMQTEGSVELVRRAKERGVPVSCEVNHWALFLSRWTDIERLGPYALSYWVPDHHREAVWGALNDGTINMLSSDHAPHTRAEKEVGWEDCWACHTGTPGIQEQYPMLLDCSMDGLISLPRVAEVVAEEPAREFKLASKGFLRPGYDADIVIFDPADATRHSADTVLSKCGWTPMTAGSPGPHPSHDRAGARRVRGPQGGGRARLGPPRPPHTVTVNWQRCGPVWALGAASSRRPGAVSSNWQRCGPVWALGAASSRPPEAVSL